MRTEGRVEYSSLNSMPMRMLREKVQFLYLPPDRPERAMQSRPLVESGNSLCHPRIAATHAPSLSRALPLPAPPSPCPSFPRQSSLKEGAARSMSLLCNEEPAARCILACSACTLARSRSSAHPRSTSTTPLLVHTAGWFWEDKIKIALHMGAQGVICKGHLQSLPLPSA